MFEHQADAYILNHHILGNAPISSLTDYSQFDHVDILDDSELEMFLGTSLRVPDHSCHSSDDSITHSEHLSILLPSTLGWKWCIQNNVQSLAEKEAKLCIAQATDAIHSMRLALGFKSALFRGKVQPANMQQTKTRAWDAIHSVDATTHQHARNYSAAREAYLRIQQAYPVRPELPSYICRTFALALSF
jgi:hypothetical protein